MAEHRHLRGARLVLLRDQPSGGRRDAEAAEVLARDHLPVHALAAVFAGERHVAAIAAERHEREHRLEGGRVLAQLAEERVGERSAGGLVLGIVRPAGAALVEPLRPRLAVPVEQHEPPGIRDRQGRQHHGADQAEDRRVGADAERQRDGDDRRQPGAAQQVPDGEAQIAKDAFHGAAPLRRRDCQSRQRVAGSAWLPEIRCFRAGSLHRPARCRYSASAVPTTTPLEASYDAFRRTVPERRGTFAGLQWRWFEQGTGADALVLLPGAVGGADIFFVVFNRVAADTRVLAVDLPDTADGGAALAGFDALLDSRGVQRATLLGASFSGLFVQVFARRFPARTRALLLSHTGLADPGRASRERRSAAIAARIPAALMRGMLRLVVTLLLRRTPEKRLWRRLYAAALDSLTKESMIAQYLLAASLEEAAGAGVWTGPVLIIHSSDDVVAKPSEQARLREAFPRAEWREFPGAGHSAYSMTPTEYAETVAAFVRRSSSG